MATHPSSQAPGPAEYALIPQGEYTGKPPIRIAKPVVLVGSDEHCHLHLVSSSVSRYHALIVREDDRIYICDLGSRTKVMVNGKENRETELADGDKLRIGKFSFRLKASRPPTGAAKRPEPVRLMNDGQGVPTLPENRLVLIGRTPGSDVTLLEGSVSARHAVIFEVGAKRYIRDLDSRTGTFLNNKKIHQNQIKPGDELRIGETTMKLAEPEESSVEPAEAKPIGFTQLEEAAPIGIEIEPEEVAPMKAAPAAVAPAKVKVAEDGIPEYEPIDLDDLMPVGFEPLPIAQEIEPPAPAEEAAISLALEPAEPAVEPLEPVAVASGPPTSEPLPLELEPEPVPEEPIAEAADEPVPLAIDHSDKVPELEPEPQPAEAEEPAPLPISEIEHHDEPMPLELEPEPVTAVAEDAAPPALAASGDASEETHLDIQAPLPEAGPVEPAILGAQPDHAVVAPEPLPAMAAAPAIDLSDAPETQSEPQPSLEVEPLQPSSDNEDFALHLLAELAAGPSEEFKSVDLEPEPEPEPVPAEEPTPAASTATINLSDAPSLVEVEPEPAPESEPEPIEPAAVPNSATIDLSDAPSLPEPEPETIALPEPAEPTAASSTATINLSDAPSLLDVEPEPVAEPIPVEPPTVATASTIDLSDAPSLLDIEPEPDEQAPVSSATTIDLSDAPAIVEPEPIASVAEEISIVDSKPKIIDPVPTVAEISREAAPIAQDLPEPAAAIEIPVEVPVQKTTRGRKRKTPAEPKPPKAPRSRAKRVAPKIEDEVPPPVIESPALASVEAPEIAPPPAEPPAIEVPELAVQHEPLPSSEPEPTEIALPDIEPSAIEVPDLTVPAAAELLPEDSTLSISEPISEDFTLTAHADAIPAEEADVTPEPQPVSELQSESQPQPALESPEPESPLELESPAPREPPPAPAAPFTSVGAFAYLSGGTVNVDHSLGGMPIKLKELPPAPAGFGQVKVLYSGQASSPFSSFAKSEPLVFDEPDESVSAPSQSSLPAPSESIVAEPAPPPPAPVEVNLETVVTPPPPPDAQIPAPKPAPKISPPIPRPPPPFATDSRTIPMTETRLPRPKPATFDQPTSAFDGLAPTFRQADAFSNVEPMPINDAAFGGPRLSRSDEYNVPESPEVAARQADSAELDFAEDDFWNRTDEDDGVQVAPEVPTIKVVSRAAPRPPVKSIPSPKLAPPVKSVPPAAPISTPARKSPTAKVAAASPISRAEPALPPAPNLPAIPIPIPAPIPSALEIISVAEILPAAEAKVLPAAPISLPEPEYLPEPEIQSEAASPPESISEPEEVLPPEEVFLPEPVSLSELELVSEPESMPEPISQPEEIFSPEPVLSPEEVFLPDPISSPEPVSMPEPMPEPVSEPEPISQPEKISSPESVLPPEEVFLPEPVSLPEPEFLPDEPILLPEPEEFISEPRSLPAAASPSRPMSSARPESPISPQLPAEDEEFLDAIVGPDTPPELVETGDPIPAEAIEPEMHPSDSGEEFPEADKPIMESSAHAPSKSVGISAPPAAPVRRRRRFRIPFLMPLLLLIMGLALGAIWRFTPVLSQIVGKVTFENYIWTSGTKDGTDFEATQRRLLADDQTRRNAIEFLRKDHPDVSAGFLASPDLMGRVVSSVSINSVRDAAQAQTALQLSYTGPSKDQDRLRVMAILQSLVDANAPLLDTNRHLQNAEDQARQLVDETQQKVDQIKTQLANLQAVIDTQLPADQMAKLTAHKAELEKSRDDAEEAVNRDHNELARVEAAAGDAVTAAATMNADSSDSQLKQMHQQLTDLAAEMNSAHSDLVAGAVLARQQLESTAKQFNEQITTADEVLGSSGQLRQFVDSARDSQSKARDLINMLLIDGEDLEKQLEDTRRDVEDLIQARQQQKWADDPQLQQLRENLDSAQHRYNANVGDGIKDPRILDPIQKEIDNFTTQIKARQQQLGIDPSDVKVEEGLNNLVESLRGKLNREKMLIGQVLDPLEKQLNGLDPVVAGLPQAEKDLARQLHERLSALNQARQKYAETVGEGQVAPSAKVTELQKQIDELKDRADRRQQDLAQQKMKSRDAAHVQEIGQAKATLDADQKTMDAARAAYGETLLVFEEKQAEKAAADAAQQKTINLLDIQQTAFKDLEAAKRDRDEKQTAAEHAFSIRPITDADVVVSAESDPRMMYSLIVLGAGVLVMAVLTLISHSAAHRAHQIGASGHQPPDLAKELDHLVLPMASPPDNGR